MADEADIPQPVTNLLRNTQIDTNLTEDVKPVSEGHRQISESGTVEKNPSEEACKTLEVSETNEIPQIPVEKKTLEDEHKVENDGVIRVSKATDDDVIEKGIITAEELADAQTSVAGVEEAMESHVQVESLLSRPMAEEENRSYTVQVNGTKKNPEKIEEQLQGDDSEQLCLPSEGKGKGDLPKDEVDREISLESAADLPGRNTGYDKTVADNILEWQDSHLEMKKKDEPSEKDLTSSENKVADLKAEAGNKRNENLDGESENQTVETLDISSLEQKQQVSPDGEASSFKDAEAEVDQASHTKCIEDEEQGKILEEFTHGKSKKNSVAEDGFADSVMILTEAESVDLKTYNESTNGANGSNGEHHVLVDTSIRHEQAHDTEASSLKEAQAVVDQACHTRYTEDEQGEILEEFKYEESKQNSVAEDGDEAYQLANTVKEAMAPTEAESVDLKTYNEATNGAVGNNEEQHVLVDASIGQTDAYEGDVKLVEAITGGAENTTQDDTEPIAMQSKSLSHIFPAEKPEVEMAETPDEAEGNRDCQSNNVHQESPKGDDDESDNKEKAAEQNEAANDKCSSSELTKSSPCQEWEVIESMDEKLEIPSEAKTEDKEWAVKMVGADSNDKEIYQNTNDPKHIETGELTNDGITGKSFQQPTATGDQNLAKPLANIVFEDSYSAASSEYAEPNSTSEGQERQEEVFQETVEEKLLQTAANGETRIAEEKDKQPAATYEITRDLEVETVKSNARGLDLNLLREEDLQKDCKKQETASTAEIEEIVDEVCEASIGKRKHEEVTLESNQTMEDKVSENASTNERAISELLDYEKRSNKNEAMEDIKDVILEVEISGKDKYEMEEEVHRNSLETKTIQLVESNNYQSEDANPRDSTEVQDNVEIISSTGTIQGQILQVTTAHSSSELVEENLAEGVRNDLNHAYMSSKEGSRAMIKIDPENDTSEEFPLQGFQDIKKLETAAVETVPCNTYQTDESSKALQSDNHDKNAVENRELESEEDLREMEECELQGKLEQTLLVTAEETKMVRSSNSGIEVDSIQKQEQNEQNAEKLSGRRSVDCIPDIASQMEVYPSQETDGALEESVKEDLSEGFKEEREDKYDGTKEELIKRSKACEEADKHCSEDRPNQTAEEGNIIAGTSQLEIIQTTDEDTEEVHQVDDCREKDRCKADDQENHEESDLMEGLPLAEDKTSKPEEHMQKVDEEREKIEYTQETREVSASTSLVAQTQEGAMIQEEKFSETPPNDYEEEHIIDMEKQMHENSITSDQVPKIQQDTEQNPNEINQAPILCEEEPEVIKGSHDGTKAELIMEKGSSTQKAILESVTDLQADEEEAGDLVTEEAEEKTDEEKEKPASTYTAECDELKGAEDEPMETSSSNSNLNDKSNCSQTNSLEEEFPSDQMTQFQTKDLQRAQAQNLIVMLEKQGTCTTSEDADKKVSNEDKPTKESERRVEQNSETVGITSKQWVGNLITLASNEGQETEAPNKGTAICEDDEDSLKTADPAEALIQKPEIEDVREPAETHSTDVPEDEMAEKITNTSEEMHKFGEPMETFYQTQETIQCSEDTETPASTQAREETMIPKEENPTNLGVILEQEPTKVKKDMHGNTSDSRQMPEVAETTKLKGSEVNKTVVLSEEINKGAEKVSSNKDSEEHTREERNILEHMASETDMSVNEVETVLMAKESDYSLIRKEVKEKTNEEKENPAVTYKLSEELKDAQEENIIQESHDCDTTVTETTVEMPVQTSSSNMNIDDKNDGSDKKLDEVTSSDLTSHIQISNIEYGQNQNWTETTELHGTHKTCMESENGQQDDNSLEKTEMEGKQTFEEGKTIVVMSRKQITEASDEAQESEVQDFSIDKQFSTPSLELSERVEHTLTTRVLETECQKIHEEDIMNDNSPNNPPGDKIDESVSSQHQEPTDLAVAPRGNVAHTDLFTMPEKQLKQTQHTSYELPPKKQKSEINETVEEETKEALKLANEGPEDASGADRNRTVEAWMEKDRIQEHAASTEDKSGVSRTTHPVEKVEKQIPASTSLLSTEILEDECSKNKMSQISGETEEKTKETQKLVDEGLEDASGIDRSRPAEAGLDANRIQEQAAAVEDESASVSTHPVEKIQESFLALDCKTAAADEIFHSQVLPVVELLEKKILKTIENPLETKRVEVGKLHEERNIMFSIEKKIPEVPLQEDKNNTSAAQTCSDNQLEKKLHTTPSESGEDMVHCKMTVTNHVEEDKPAEEWQVAEINRTETLDERLTELGEVKITDIQASTPPELEKPVQTPTLALPSMEDLPNKKDVEKVNKETKEAEFLDNKNQEPSATAIETTETVQLHEVVHELKAVEKDESATSTTSTTDEQIPSQVIPLRSRQTVNQSMTSIDAIEDMQEKDALKKPKIKFGEENVAPTIKSQTCLGEWECGSEVQIPENDHVAGKTNSNYRGNHTEKTYEQNEFADNRTSNVEVREAFETSSPTSGSPEDMKDIYHENFETPENEVFVGTQSIRESNNTELKTADVTKFIEIPETDYVAQEKIRAEGNEDLSSEAPESEGSKGIAGGYEKIQHEPVNASDVALDRQNSGAIQPTEITKTVIPAVSESLPLENRNVLEETIKERELTGTGNADNNSSEGTRPEVEGKDKIQNSKKETIVSTLMGTETETPSLSDLLQSCTKEKSETGAQVEPREIKEAAHTKQETAERAKIEEEENEEQEGDEQQQQEDSSSDAPVIIDVVNKDAKVSAKKSHNILSGVGSKVKHSISKVKKAITGKSSHAKPASPKGKDFKE